MSRWSPRAVAVVFVALLVATATPVMAADPALEVVDEHTTDSDFSSASLTNASVEGTGTGASVVMTRWNGKYDVVNDSGDGTTDGTDPLVGDDGSNNVYRTEIRLEPDENVTLPQAIDIYTSVGAGSDYGFTVDVYLVEEAPDGTYQEGTLISSGWNPSFTNGWQSIPVNTDVNLTAGQTYTLEFVNAQGDLDSTADRLDVRIDNSVSGTWYQSNVDGSLGHAAQVNITGKESPQTATYIGGNYSAATLEACNADLVLDNSSATITCQGWTGSSWTDVASATVSTNGVHNVTFSETTHSKWRVKVEFSRSSDYFTAQLDDEAILFNAATPSVNDSTASPSGGETVTDPTTTLSINVSDADFATSQSDSLTVEWYVDGSKVDTTTVASNGTASTSVSTPGGGGTHTWHAVVTDSYGETDTSSTFNFETPSTLFIRNESNVSQLVDNATVELTFYFRNGTGSDFSVTKTSSDGTVNMTGLPADQPFVVVAESNGYYTRRIFVPSLFETQTVYLLPQNVTAVDTVFVIEDYTGDFPPDDTVLLVQRSLNGTWKTVLGDYFGATREFPGQVAYNQRHRLVLLNVETGETKVMGTYTPITAATQEVVVSPSGGLTVRTAGAAASIRPQFGQLPALNGTTVAVRFENNSASVANWTVNASVNGTTVWLQTYASPQRVTNDLDLAPYAGQTLTVRVTYTDSNGTTFLVRERTFQIQQTLDNNATLLAVIQDFAQQSPSSSRDSFTAFLAMAITVLGMAGVATQFPVSGEAVALVGVFILTGFSVIGWVGYGLVFAAGVGTIAFAGLKRGL